MVPLRKRERYEDFFCRLSGIVEDAVSEKVDFVLICGDLFHNGQILPKTFAKTIEVLQPLKMGGIPCIAIEGNHDWIHRRNNISWMEALLNGVYSFVMSIPDQDGGYHFDLFNEYFWIGGAHKDRWLEYLRARLYRRSSRKPCPNEYVRP